MAWKVSNFKKCLDFMKSRLFLAWNFSRKWINFVSLPSEGHHGSVQVSEEWIRFSNRPKKSDTI